MLKARVHTSNRKRAVQLFTCLGMILTLFGLNGCDTDTSPSEGLIILNEVACSAGDFVEIVNVSDEDQDISGWYVADNKYKAGHQYKIPDGTVLPPKEYLPIYKDDNGVTGFAFGIKCEGEGIEGDTIYLLDENKALVDQVEVGFVSYAKSWGRFPDLTGIWRETTSTPAKINEPPSTGLSESSSGE